MRSPAIQSYVAGKAAGWLSDKLGTEVSIEGFGIRYFLDLELKNISIKDAENNDFIRIENLTLDFLGFHYLKRQLKLESITLSGAEVGLYKKHLEGFNYNHLISAFNSKSDSLDDIDENQDIHLPALDLHCKKLRIENTRFIYENNTRRRRQGFDWNHLNLDIRHLVLSEIRMNHDTIFVMIDSLKTNDTSGFGVKKLSGNFFLSPQAFRGKDVVINTNYSDLHLDYNFAYSHWNDWNDFEKNVTIETNITHSKLNTSDIGYFSSSLRNMYNTLYFSGKAKGRIGHLNATDFIIRYGKGTHFMGNISISGLPDIEESFILADVKSLETNARDLNNLSLPVYDGQRLRMELPSQIENLGFIRMSGEFSGFYNDFVSKGLFNTGLGGFKTDIKLKYNPKEDIFEYTGDLTASSFDLGTFTGYAPNLGDVSLKTHIKGKGFSIKNARMKLEGSIDTIRYNNYAYRNILIDAHVSDKQFNGSLNVQDKNIDFHFKGLIDYTEEIPLFNFVSTLKSARLFDLNLRTFGDPNAVLSGKIDANFRGDKLDDILGKIRIDSLNLAETERSYLMKKAIIEARKTNDSNKRIDIYSDFIDAHIKGIFDFSKIASSSRQFVHNYIASFQASTEHLEKINENYNLKFSVLFKDTETLTDLFFPNLKISPLSSISGNFNTGKALLQLKGNADEIDYRGVKFKKWFLHSSTLKNIMTFSTGSNRIVFREEGETDSLNLGISDFSVYSNVSNNRISFIFKWDDQKKKRHNAGNIRGIANFIDYPETNLRFSGSSFTINDTTWTIPTTNSIDFDTLGIHFGHFILKAPSEEISLSGSLSKDTLSRFDMGLKNVNLSNFDMITALAGIDINGLVDGSISLNNIYQKPLVFSDLRIQNMELNHHKLGQASLRSNWDYSSDKIQIDIVSTITGEGYQYSPLDIKGNYFPENDSIHSNIILQNLDAGIIEPYMEGIISDIEGFASGNFKINGLITKPKIEGSLSVMRGQARADYLNTLYTYTGDVFISDEVINFKNFIFYDSLGNPAPLSGSIGHNYFNNFKLNLNLQPNNLFALNNTKTQNSVFYGSALVSGAVNIDGTDNNVLMDVNVETQEGTEINIPLNTTEDVSENNFVTFVNAEETNPDSPKKSGVNANVTGLKLNMDMRLNNKANITIFLPEQSGSIKARGNGDIKMNIDEEGNFDIDGEYVIRSGSLLIRLRGILNRMLDINQGSSITFDGNPYDAKINLTATYKLRTTLAGLDLPLDSTVLNVRTPVNCLVRLQDELMNPKISFGIYFPGVEEDIKNLIYSRLDTTDEVSMTKQFFSLLVLNNFSFQFNNQGIASSISTSSLSLISNQLSNWLSQISKDFDIGINYRPGNELSAEEVEVALSTQLFDNRVIIDGNIGYADRQKYSSQTSDIVGDVNVEIKITNDGQLRAKVFNRSNNVDLLNTTAPYTQGVGISYRRDFDNLRELFGIKKKKHPKQQKP